MAAPDEEMVEDHTHAKMSKADASRIAGTNLEHIGSAAHRELRQNAARGERAWDGIEGSDEERVRVWRIEKFNVVHWPEDQYGDFYTGDSFIILNSYKEEDALKYNVHFWLGKETTQDEAGTAAYKTVELDDLLGDLPVQYREVEGHESKHFKTLFPVMNIMQGGVETGFRHVEPESYPHRLFHIHGRKRKCEATEVPMSVEQLNSSDCFVLDTGAKAIRFLPPGASVWEKRASNDFVNNLHSHRNGRLEKSVIEWDDDSPDAEEFWGHFGGKPDELGETSAAQQAKAAEEEAFASHVNCIYHVTDEDGEMSVTKVQEGVLDRSILDQEQDDVLLVDVGRVIFVWIGATSNPAEKREAMVKAQDFLASTGRPFWTPIERICSGAEPADFWKCFGCEHVPTDIHQ